MNGDGHMAVTVFKYNLDVIVLVERIFIKEITLI